MSKVEPLQKPNLLTRAELRKLIRQKRANLSLNEQKNAGEKLSEKLKEVISNFVHRGTKTDFNNADFNITESIDEKIKTIKVALYLANDGELDPLPFIHWCWQQNNTLMSENNIEVYLPVIHPFSKGNLLFLKYEADTKMIKNKYGISEPKLNVQNICLAKDLDILFTPLVAFDHAGNRLGMGGGFYDRTLAAFSTKLVESPHNIQGSIPSLSSPLYVPLSSPLIIGLAHECQRVDTLPTEAWDIPIQTIITPQKRYTF